MMRRFLLLLAAMSAFASCARAQSCVPEAPAIIRRLDDAMKARDLAGVHAIVAEANPQRRAPAPETPERYAPLPDARLAQADLARVTARFVTDAERASWWRSATPTSPQDVPAPLRFPARLARGALALAEMDTEAAPRLRELATSAGDYLIQASAEARFDGAPFPYWRGREGRLGDLAERMARRLEQCGELEQSIRNGWFVIEEAPWEYYFDTGLSGEALARLYLATGQQRHLDAALRAGAWAHAQPISTNWNYNAFIVGFFVELSRASGDPIWLARAVERARFGVLPGMIAEGPDAGHFVDPHNQRIAYRAIMARSLVQLAGALAEARHSARGEMESGARLVLAALERHMRDNGVTSPTAMAEVYAAVAVARGRGADIASGDAELRSGILHAVAAAALAGDIAPDAGVAEAIVLLRAEWAAAR